MILARRIRALPVLNTGAFRGSAIVARTAFGRLFPRETSLTLADTLPYFVTAFCHGGSNSASLS